MISTKPGDARIDVYGFTSRLHYSRRRRRNGNRIRDRGRGGSVAVGVGAARAAYGGRGRGARRMDRCAGAYVADCGRQEMEDRSIDARHAVYRGRQGGGTRLIIMTLVCEECKKCGNNARPGSVRGQTRGTPHYQLTSDTTGKWRGLGRQPRQWRQYRQARQYRLVHFPSAAGHHHAGRRVVQSVAPRGAV